MKKSIAFSCTMMGLLCSALGSPSQMAFEESFHRSLAATPPEVLGTNSVWYGTVSKIWSTAGNWTNLYVPTTNDTAVFNNAGNGNIAIGLGVNSTYIKNLVFTNSSMAVYSIGSNTTETLNWTPGGSMVMHTNAGNNISMGSRIYVGSSTGASSYTIACYSKSGKAIGLSQGNGRIEGLPTGNGDVTLYLHADVKDGVSGVNLAGQMKNATNGANCKITKIVKTGAGLANIGSGTPANTFVADIYLDEGGLSIVGKQNLNLIAGNRLFINTNTCLLCVNQTPGDFVGITNFWNGDFSFNDITYFTGIKFMSMGSGCRVDLGQYGTDPVRTVNVMGTETFTLNCPIDSGSNGHTKGLKKIGPAPMFLGGTNTFTSTFIVTNGTVTLTVTNCLASTNLQVVAPGILFCRTNYCLPSNVTINLDGSYGKMRLSNNVPQSVAAFYTNGVLQASGTWGATGSGCANTNDNCFLGAGVISVP